MIFRNVLFERCLHTSILYTCLFVSVEFQFCRRMMRHHMWLCHFKIYRCSASCPSGSQRSFCNRFTCNDKSLTLASLAVAATPAVTKKNVVEDKSLHQGQRNVEFFDGHTGLWRILHKDLHGEILVEWAAEEERTPHDMGCGHSQGGLFYKFSLWEKGCLQKWRLDQFFRHQILIV